MIGRLIIGALAIAALSFAGIALAASLRVASLSEEIARLERNALVIERVAAENSRARGIAQREAERWRLRSQEFETALSELTEGIEDAEIDIALRNRINRVLRGE
jgi:hypothetical protein